MVNSSGIRTLARFKNFLVPAGKSPRSIKFGLYKDIVLDLDLRSQTQMLFGLWERETYSFVSSKTVDVRWLVDIGAGSGEMSLYFLRRGNAVDVTAVEPNPSEVDALRHHLELNKLSPDACRIVNAEIGRHAGATSLEDLLRPLHGAGFIKIDVDGAEMDVLESAGDRLDQGPVALLIETHSMQLEVACMNWLKKRSFDVSIIDNAWWRRAIPDGRVIEHNRWLSATRGF